MSGYTSNLREYTDPSPGTPPKPREYSSDISIVTHPGAETHGGGASVGYGNGSSLGIAKGYSITAKSGSTVFFYEDSAGRTQVGPAGGKGGQANPPSRSGTGNELEYVGTFTGNATNEFIQVDWVNRWWQDAKFYPLTPWKNEKGQYKTESKTSWVKVSAVDWSAVYVDPKNPTVKTDDLPPPSGGGTTTTIDGTTLGMVAVGAALFLKGKKRK